MLALLVWQAASVCVGSELLLASPAAVLKRLAALTGEKGFFTSVLRSFLRIFTGFLIAVLAGTALAALAGRYETAEVLLRPYVTVMKTVPVASFIVLCLFWFSAQRLTALIAFLISFPTVYQNVLQGIRSADGKLSEMARLCRMPARRRILYLYLPAVRPHLLSASSLAAGMAWKAGVAAEVIGIVGGSVGEKLYEAKVLFLNADLLAWTVVIVLASVLMEKGFLLLLKAGLGRAVRR